jgi:microcystin-dependent protein
MADPFIGQILLVGFNFAPVNWHLCDGTLLPIQQYPALFSLLGTYYGGDGVNNFALPDLRSRVPVGIGQGVGLTNYTIGQTAGAETVTLLASQMPSHNHAISADNAITNGAATPANNYLAAGSSGGRAINNYSTAVAAPAVLNGNSVSFAGANQAHNNIQPVLALNYIIALQGIFPSRQ